MPPSAWPGPRRSIEDLALRLGSDEVVRTCVQLLDGVDVEPALVHTLGGPPARWALEGGASGADYWLRVWALRGLLWNWGDQATPALVRALEDESWRVREMAAKVAAKHRVDAALEPLLPLQQDPIARVRAAAHRAVESITTQRL